jgi:sugar-specific transcriptional regulator TrmB
MFTPLEIKEKLEPLLASLGLREQEIQAFTTSLALGPMSVSTLADHLGMSAPNAYKVIAGLEKAGLTQFSQTKRRGQLFSVVSPQVLTEKLESQQMGMQRMKDEYQNLLPDLLANYHQGDAPSRIRVLNGKRQFEAAITKMFEEAKDNLIFFGSVADFVGSISQERFQLLTKDRIARKIMLRSLMLPSKEADALLSSQQNEMREARILKSAPPFTTSFQLSHSQVILWQPKAPLAIIIDDEYIIEMLRSMFEVMWNASI